MSMLKYLLADNSLSQERDATHTMGTGWKNE